MTARQRTVLVIGLVVVGLMLLIGLGLNRGAGAPTAATSSPRTSAAASAGPATGSGLAACRSVPGQVHEAVEAVRADGPYLRPRDDGGIFGNRERLLPAKPSGYYREYTVRAPGERFPGPRRLITGGQTRPGAEPEIWFYTADHYESFCELQPES